MEDLYLLTAFFFTNARNPETLSLRNIWLINARLFSAFNQQCFLSDLDRSRFCNELEEKSHLSCTYGIENSTVFYKIMRLENIFRWYTEEINIGFW